MLMNFILIYQHIKIISCGKYIQIFKCVFKLNDVCKHHATQLHTDLCTVWKEREGKEKSKLTHTLAYNLSVDVYFQRASLNNSSVFYNCECVCECVCVYTGNWKRWWTALKDHQINMMLKLKLKLMVCVRSMWFVRLL